MNDAKNETGGDCFPLLLRYINICMAAQENLVNLALDNSELELNLSENVFFFRFLVFGGFIIFKFKKRIHYVLPRNLTYKCFYQVTHHENFVFFANVMVFDKIG